MMEELPSKLLRWCGGLILAYLAIAFLLGILSYLLPTHPGEMPTTEHYLSDSIGPDRALLVERPDQALGRRVEVIRSAQDTLDVVCHCVKAGETTDCFFGELVQAADRGVKVRVLLDGAIGGFTGSHKNIPLGLNAHPNIEYRDYNPVNLLKPWGWNVRLHDKFILADGRTLLLGGRNIGDEYFDPPGYTGSVTWDRDVLVLNTAAPFAPDSVTAQVRDYMEQLWTAPETKAWGELSQRKLLRGGDELARLREISHRWAETCPKYYFPEIPAAELALPTSRITLVTNPLGEFKKVPVIGAALEKLLSGCRDIRIQTPYATANRHILAGLTELADRGQVELLTNSTASSPNLPAFSNYIANRKKFLETGVTLHEYQSRNSIHGKSATADGRIAVVGSFNLDDRSLYIDTETVLVIDSPGFTATLDGAMGSLRAQSAQVGEDNHYLPGQVLVEASGVKKVLMCVVSVFSGLFRFLV